MGPQKEFSIVVRMRRCRALVKWKELWTRRLALLGNCYDFVLQSIEINDFSRRVCQTNLPGEMKFQSGSLVQDQAWIDDKLLHRQLSSRGNSVSVLSG